MNAIVKGEPTPAVFVEQSMLASTQNDCMYPSRQSFTSNMHALQLHYRGNALNQAPEALVVKSVSLGKRPPSDAFSQLQEPER